MAKAAMALQERFDLQPNRPHKKTETQVPRSNRLARPMMPPLQDSASLLTRRPIDYSFCSLVTKPALYQAMVQSFAAAGFDAESCEFIHVDNTLASVADGYSGLNQMIAKAEGRYVILAHQDLLAIETKAKLDSVLVRLTQVDPAWAVAGNAGCDALGRQYTRITDRHGFNVKFPGDAARVMSLDENFIILRKDAALGFSEDLCGFHLYGTDIVFQAHLRGRSAYAVDFHLEHLGAGKIDQSFVTCMQAFQRKYRQFGPRLQVKTPSTRVSLGARSFGTWLWQRKLARRVARGETAAWSHKLKRLTAALADLWYRRVLRKAYRLEGLALDLSADAPLALRKALRRGRHLQGEAGMIAKHLRPDLAVVLQGSALSLLQGHIRRATGGNHELFLQQSLEANMPKGGFALVTAQANLLYDLLQDRPEVLAPCSVIILSLHPADLHDSGRSVSGFLASARHNGFAVVETDGAAVVLRRAA